VANNRRKVIEIHTEDLEDFLDGQNGSQLLVNIMTNTKRY